MPIASRDHDRGVGGDVSPLRTYRISPVRRAIVPAIFGGLFGLMGVAIVLEQPAVEPRGALLLSVLGIGALVVAPLFWLVNRTRLSIGPAGLTLRQTGFSIATEWDNIERLDLTQGSEGLFLTEERSLGLVGSVRNMPRSFSQLTDVQLEAFAAGRFVPLAPFMWYWKRGLADDLKVYANRLFSQE